MADDIKTATVDEGMVGRFVKGLAAPGRRTRQEMAHRIAEISKSDPKSLEPYVEQLVDALYRPEAQTRWEVLDALTELAAISPDEVESASPDGVESAFDGAEASLFDEESSTVRLAAFLFLVRMAGTSPERSERAWPLLDEAVQCFHGDPEYRDMLQGMLVMAHGNISDDVRKKLVGRVSFDAENGVGFIKTYSVQIVEAAS